LVIPETNVDKEVKKQLEFINENLHNQMEESINSRLKVFQERYKKEIEEKIEELKEINSDDLSAITEKIEQCNKELDKLSKQRDSNQNLLEKKLEQAKKTYREYSNILKDNDGNPVISNTADHEDGQQNLSTESASIMASRQEKFIKNLENALIRIQNKTYGIDRKTGELIPKARLLAVPHATLTVESKESMGK